MAEEGVQLEVVEEKEVKKVKVDMEEVEFDMEVMIVAVGNLMSCEVRL